MPPKLYLEENTQYDKYEYSFELDLSSKYPYSATYQPCDLGEII